VKLDQPTLPNLRELSVGETAENAKRESARGFKLALWALILLTCDKRFLGFRSRKPEVREHDYIKHRFAVQR